MCPSYVSYFSLTCVDLQIFRNTYLSFISLKYFNNYGAGYREQRYSNMKNYNSPIDI